MRGLDKNSRDLPVLPALFLLIGTLELKELIALGYSPEMSSYPGLGNTESQAQLLLSVLCLCVFVHTHIIFLRYPGQEPSPW